MKRCLIRQLADKECSLNLNYSLEFIKNLLIKYIKSIHIFLKLKDILQLLVMAVFSNYQM